MLGLVQPLGAAGRGDAEGPERNLRALPPDRRTTSLGCHCRVAPEGLLPMSVPPTAKDAAQVLRGCSGGGEERGEAGGAESGRRGGLRRSDGGHP